MKTKLKIVQQVYERPPGHPSSRTVSEGVVNAPHTLIKTAITKMASVGQGEDGRDLCAAEKNGTGLAIMEDTTEVHQQVEPLLIKSSKYTPKGILLGWTQEK